MCYNTGLLQALLDGEITGSKKAEMEEHLRVCHLCRDALEKEKGKKVFTDTRLTAYLQSLGQAEVDTGAAWSLFERKHNKEKKTGQKSIESRKGVLTMLSRYRVAATAAVIVLALAVSFSFGSVRSAASELLTIFRVEKVKTVSITPSDMAGIERAIREGTGSVDIVNFGEVEFIGEQQSAGKVSLEEALAMVDFPLILPASPPNGSHAPEIYQEAGGNLNLTLDTVNANKILESFGSISLLPDGLNGKTFTIKIPAVICARYVGPDDQNVTVFQGRSPELIAPGSDVSAIREALLGLPFLPENLRKQLAAINDWQRTFVVPNVGGSSQEVNVAGTQGVYIKPPAGDSSRGSDISSLVWQRNGVVYAVSGSLTLEQSLDIAASMK